MWRRWLARLGEVARRPELEADLDDELTFHLESEAERLEREEGLSPSEARRRARRDFVGVERCKEDVRAARGLPALMFLGRDLQYGLRGLIRHPTFTIVAVLSLAIGIGINVAVFSVVDATLFRPYPYDPDDRLVQIGIDTNDGRGRNPTVDEYLALQSLTDVFDEFSTGGYGGTVHVVGERGALGLLRMTHWSPGRFQMLGGAPVLGRVFGIDEERVALISHRVWQTHFGGDSTVLGETVWMLPTEDVPAVVTSRDRIPLTVVGVLPEGFQQGTDLWLPYRIDSFPLAVVAMTRLAPGVTPERAKAVADATIAGRSEAQVPPVVQFFAHRESQVRSVRSQLVALWSAVSVVLLIACINVAALTLARATARSREVATRLALGASRWRIAQLLLAESGMLTLAGATLGTFLAYAGVRLLRFLNNVQNPYISGLFPQMSDAGIDGRVFAYTLLVSAAVALLFGVLPALSGSRPGVGRALQDARRGTTPRRLRFRRALVVAQVAFALVLLTGAGLVARSMANLLAVDHGFDTERLLVVETSLPSDVYLADSGPDPIAFQAELIRRVAALPGVVSASGISTAPLNHESAFNKSFMLADRPAPPAGEVQRHGVGPLRSVHEGAFETLGIPVLRGRTFTADDTLSAPAVAIISQATAENYWPDGDPIGQQFWFVDRSSGQRLPGEGPREIVGVVGDTRQWSPQAAPDRSLIYLPQGQLPPEAFASERLNHDLLIRTQGLPEMLVPAVRDVIADLDPRWVSVEMHSVRELASIWTDGPRFMLLLLAVFAAVGLALALAGVYGVMAYAVMERTQEIGVRMALGAARRQVIGLVVRQGLALGIAGLAIGLLGAWWLTRFVQAVSFPAMGGSILYEVEPRDMTTFVVSAVLLLGAVLLACYGPTRRATRVDPMTVLRHE